MAASATKRCAYLTMDDTAGWSIDAELAFPPMRELGWSVETVRWRMPPADWDAYDAVYIGTPWDYPEDPERFLSLLETVDRSAAILVNDVALVRWTMPKTYLRDLERRGADIVPSLWYERWRDDRVARFFDEHDSERIIVKPVVSTNATDTYLLERQSADADELRQAFATRPFVVQPFISNIRSEGEYSLFYFANEFSHAIRKVPRAADFRVQEEHGAQISAVDPETRLLDAGRKVLRLVEPMPVYARVDFVRDDDGCFLLMELEVIEPSMYLRMDPEAPRKFAEAFDNYVQRKIRD